MKKMFSKNHVIAALVISNLTMGAYIIAKQIRFHAAPQAKAAVISEKPHGMVKEARVKKDTDMRECYEAFLTRNPVAAEGSMTVQWMSDENGEMTFLKLAKTDFSDEAFSACVLEKVKQTRFPAAVERAGLLVSHKFNFKKRDAKAEFH